MVLVGMGLVYMIYPAIAPGMIVPFYLVDKIDMILLIATDVPPVIVALLKKYNYGPFVFLGNWGGNHNAFGPAESDPITQATLDLTDLTSGHTLTLQKSDGGAVQVVKYTVDSEQKSKITRIKQQTGTATINLTLTLTEVTLTLNGNTLKATGSITVTRNVTPSGGQKLETALTGSHTLEFTSSSTLTQGNLDSGGSNSVTIGPSSGATNSLNLTAADPGDNQSRPTKLNLTLKAGTKRDGDGGELPNESLTLDSGNNSLTLSGGIEGTLTYASASSGTLTANIINISFDPNDFHYRYRTQY
ncbi:Tpr-related protein family member, putative [Theileria annulata]|uniref:Tpr-related protein family member, putative n=1 Tax=Theileria annulata TaxID=5874 RepID=Q4UIZ3_THEAN|nr:Tpr-related protein family member, putative [Theileria annulata]CAI72946.1 Tpr-related protein family member, putative [Theileria annulata]|eukprot:XP_953624.1 Tpr-related protein family member, putative [Theileria annulata]